MGNCIRTKIIANRKEGCIKSLLQKLSKIKEELSIDDRLKLIRLKKDTSVPKLHLEQNKLYLQRQQKNHNTYSRSPTASSD